MEERHINQVPLLRVPGNLYIGGYWPFLCSDSTFRHELHLTQSHQLNLLLIDCVISIGFEESPFKFEKSSRFCYSYFIHDGQGWDVKLKMDVYLDSICKLMYSFLSREKNVFVHCRTGVSCSAIVIISYLVEYEEMSPFEAKDLLRSKRSCVRLSPVFCDLLTIRYFRRPSLAN